MSELMFNMFLPRVGKENPDFNNVLTHDSNGKLCL